MRTVKNHASESLRRHHERLHLDIRPFTCEYCDKRFVTKDRLRGHIRTHTGEKPYECDQCDFACAERGNLRKHKRNKHKSGSSQPETE